MASLVVVEGPAAGQKFALGEARLVMVGRDEAATFQILDLHVSRCHLQLKRDAESKGHFACDFPSANGVLVNESRLSEDTLLSDGDTIRIGDTVLVYSVEDAPDAQTIADRFRDRYRGETILKQDEPGPS